MTCDLGKLPSAAKLSRGMWYFVSLHRSKFDTIILCLSVSSAAATTLKNLIKLSDCVILELSEAGHLLSLWKVWLPPTLSKQCVASLIKIIAAASKM